MTMIGSREEGITLIVEGMERGHDVCEWPAQTQAGDEN